MSEEKKQQLVVWNLSDEQAQVVMNCVNAACQGIAQAKIVMPVACELEEQLKQQGKLTAAPAVKP